MGPCNDTGFQNCAELARKHTVLFTPGVLSGPPRMRFKNIELFVVDESE